MSEGISGDGTNYIKQDMESVLRERFGVKGAGDGFGVYRS